MSTEDAESNVLENRRIFFASLGLDLTDVVVARLSHGRKVSVFRVDSPGEYPAHVEAARTGSSYRERVFYSDAVVSNVPGLNFMLTAADCVPLAFAAASTSRAVGGAHAGWRGTALSIASGVVRSMVSNFGVDPRDLAVGIGPSIGPCCYSVAPDVLERFSNEGNVPVVHRRGGKTYLDLWATNENQLMEAGVPASMIENQRICTSCNVGDFYSHRREGGTTGRFALCIGL